jgi:tRNA dimethylallyltransferase
LNLDRPQILLIGGPTASGKSRLALEISKELPTEIINADSRQAYRKLSIGTAQPGPQDFAQILHHLYSFIEPSENFTAADYERVATVLVKEIQQRQRLPLFVGGTGFYMKALLRGVWPVPPKNEELRARLRKIQKRHHPQFLHHLLMRVDRRSAASIAPADTYRIIRALEIYYQSGVRRSELRRNQQERYDALKYYVDPERDQLHLNIENRTESMFAKGWIEEVEALLDLYPDFANMPAAKSLGYQEILRYLQGETDLVGCKQEVILRTKQYAKRQLTWFRNQDGFQPIPSGEPLHKIVDSVLQWYRK